MKTKPAFSRRKCRTLRGAIKENARVLAETKAIVATNPETQEVLAAVLSATDEVAQAFIRRRFYAAGEKQLGGDAPGKSS